jgi:hypothetical protein
MEVSVGMSQVQKSIKILCEHLKLKDLMLRLIIFFIRSEPDPIKFGSKNHNSYQA